MRLAEPLVSKNGQVLLQGGRVLTASEIATLQRRFQGLNVRVGDPVLDDVIEFEDDSEERSVADAARQMVSESVSRVQQRFAKHLSREDPEHTSLGGAELAALQKALNRLMQFLKENPASLALITSCLDNNSYLSTHTGNVFYLSMLLGSKNIDYVVAERTRQTSGRGIQTSLARDLTPLGLGVMTMDLGLLPLQNLFKSDQPLTEADRRAIRRHPIVGAQMLPQNVSAVTRMIVRTHHENLEGTGYPKALAGEELHVFTRIVRIADAYDAVTSKHVYKGAKPAVRALWEMLVGPYKRFYDPKLMVSFARLIQPFPIGSRLRLEDGRYAVVVRYNRKTPFKPTVVVAFDAHNKPVCREELEDPVELSSHSDLRIRSFCGEDLSYLYDNESEENAEAREGFATLLQAAFP